jgi:hypothetical protein
VPYETLLKLEKKSERRRAMETVPVSEREREGGAQKRKRPSGGGGQRAARDGPAEESAKVPVKRFRQVVAPARRGPVRDPRFDDLSGGTFRPAVFAADYGFLSTMRDGEIKELKDDIKDMRAKIHDGGDGGGDDTAAIEEEVEKKRTALRVLEQQKRAEDEAAKQRASKRVWRKEQEARVRAGRQPFFPKRRQEKVARAVERFRELKAKGGTTLVERTIEKAHRRAQARAKRSMPFFQQSPY